MTDAERQQVEGVLGGLNRRRELVGVARRAS